LLNYLFPTVSIQYYCLPIAYVHALYIFQKSSSQRVLGLPIGLLDTCFHLLIFCTLLSSAMRSTWPNQFNLCFLINPNTAALEGGEWSAARPDRTLPEGKTRYPFYRRLGGPQGWSGRAENLVPTGIRSRTVQPVAHSLYRLSYRAQITTYAT